MKLKGISLPIEMMVIIAIAVLVLVVVGAFFIGGVGKLGTVDDISAFGQGCQQWKAVGCSNQANQIFIKGYDPTGTEITSTNTAGDTLQTACERLSKLDSASSCKKACGCP